MQLLRYQTQVLLMLIGLLLPASWLYAAPNKVYIVKAAELINVATAKGYQLHARKNDKYSLCEIVANIMIIKRNPAVDPNNYHAASCTFTLFKPGKLAKDWKVQAMSVISNGRGNWRYLHKPQGEHSLLTIINGTKTNKAAFDLELKLNDIVLIGPGDSKSWQQALPKIN